MEKKNDEIAKLKNQITELKSTINFWREKFRNSIVEKLILEDAVKFFKKEFFLATFSAGASLLFVISEIIEKFEIVPNWLIENFSNLTFTFSVLTLICFWILYFSKKEYLDL